MFDIGWSELLIIGVVALIVVGPKDLPKMFRTLGQVTGKLRGMAREFTRAMEAAADETGVKDVAKSFRETASGKTLREAAGFDEIEKEFRDIGHDRPVTRPVSSPGSSPKGGPKPEVDPETAARNAALGETEAERLKRAERAAEARRQAAEIRARREAEAQEKAQAQPDAAPPPPAEPKA